MPPAAGTWLIGLHRAHAAAGEACANVSGYGALGLVPGQAPAAGDDSDDLGSYEAEADEPTLEVEEQPVELALNASLPGLLLLFGEVHGKGRMATHSS